MAQKWQTISELAAETSRKVTHSPEEWCRFLTTAARFYKAYDFDDQLLIYAQKPNATACADMPTWNNKMRRWVNAGSTAIALIRKGYGGKPYLDYVHDVADTHPVRGGKDPWLWKLTEENREPVMERLRDTFGIDGSGDLGDLLMETAEKLVQECDMIARNFGVPVSKRLWFCVDKYAITPPQQAISCNTFGALVEEVANTLG